MICMKCGVQIDVENWEITACPVCQSDLTEQSWEPDIDDVGEVGV